MTQTAPLISVGTKLTFAISLQLFPTSRICFSLCSSAAVHGVLVRPVRFLPLSSLSNEDIDTLDVGSGRGRVVPGGSVSSFGLFEARRLRELCIGVIGGGTSDTGVLGGGNCVVGGGMVLNVPEFCCGISAETAIGEALVAVDLCRLCGGGVLNGCQIDSGTCSATSQARRQSQSM